MDSKVLEGAFLFLVSIGWNVLMLGIGVVAVVWIVQRMRHVRVLEERVNELEGRLAARIGREVSARLDRFVTLAASNPQTLPEEPSGR